MISSDFPLKIQRASQKITQITQKRRFWTKKRALSRIGPHNEIIMSILIGGLLGDLHANKQNNATRIQFHGAKKNKHYIFWLHKVFSENGYCSPKPPKLCHSVSKKTGVLTYSYKFTSFSFTSFNWLHDIFYPNGVKIIPREIQSLLTPRALAILFMDDGYRCKQGVCIALLSFCFDDVVLFQKMLKQNFHLESTLQRVVNENKKVSWRLYVPKNQMTLFVELVKPYLLESMLYKLGQYA